LQENLVESINREAAPISKVTGKDGRRRAGFPLSDGHGVEINNPWNRGITARLWIGDLEQRLRREIVFGAHFHLNP